MGLISRVSSRTYRKPKIKMATTRSQTKIPKNIETSPPEPEETWAPEPEQESSTDETTSNDIEDQRRVDVSNEREDIAEVPSRYKERPSKWPTGVQEKNGFYYALRVIDHRPKGYSATKFMKNSKLRSLEYKIEWYGKDKKGNDWPATWEP